jgi:acetolactate synthase-1/3 small subunit
MTIVCNGDEQILEQITKQLAKLIDVRNIKVLDPDNSVKRELVLLKISARSDQRQGIISIADIFRAKVVDVSKESLIIEMTGSKSKLKAFIELLDEYEILELARTGLTGLSRGSDDVTFL